MSSNDEKPKDFLDADLVLEVLDVEFEANLLLSRIQFDEYSANLKEIEPY
jgi:hypothetical protein